jgi:putative oxidoreductase
LLEYIGVPFPGSTAWIVTLLELSGGFAILVGAFVAIASVPLAATMLVAMFTIHLKYGFSSIKTIGLTPDGPRFGPPGYEVNLLYVSALIALAWGGAGALSVDRFLARRRGKRVS